VNAIPDTRPSPIAGTWYSDDPRELALQIDRFLSAADPGPIDGDVIALVAPHAGLRYSGRTAAHAFAAIAGQERKPVAVLSPFHNYHPAPVLTTLHAAYATPLGRVPVCHDLLADVDSGLRRVGMSGLVQLAGDPEHALEIELPFLQRALRNDLEIIPLMVRAHHPELCARLGSILAEVLDGARALLVASTDLSHFHPERNARALDTAVLERIEQFDPAGIFAVQESGRGYACGVGAVAAVLHAARRLGADTVKIVHYSTSAAETGDASSVVGYGAAVIYRRKAI